MGCLVESGDVDVGKIIAADVEIGKVGETFEILPVEDGDKVDTEIEMLEPVQLRGGVGDLSEGFPGNVIVDGLEVGEVAMRQREDLESGLRLKR